MYTVADPTLIYNSYEILCDFPKLLLGFIMSNGMTPQCTMQHCAKWISAVYWWLVCEMWSLNTEYFHENDLNMRRQFKTIDLKIGVIISVCRGRYTVFYIMF